MTRTARTLVVTATFLGLVPWPAAAGDAISVTLNGPILKYHGIAVEAADPAAAGRAAPTTPAATSRVTTWRRRGAICSPAPAPWRSTPRTS